MYLTLNLEVGLLDSSLLLMFDKLARTLLSLFRRNSVDSICRVTENRKSSSLLVACYVDSVFHHHAPPAPSLTLSNPVQPSPRIR